jgi:signal transduction histidine kinase
MLLKKKTAPGLYDLRRAQSALLILFTFLVLVVLNLSAWWIYLRVGTDLEQIFSRSLKESSQLAAQALAPAIDLNFPPESTASPEFIRLQSFLMDIRAVGNYNDVFLIDPAFRTIAGVFDDAPTGQIDGVLIPDLPLLEQARQGRTTLTSCVYTGGLFLQTAFSPVYGPGGRMAGILVLKADVGYMRPRLAIRNSLIGVTALSALGVVILALGYGRMMRQLQRSEERIVQNERLAGLGQLAAGIAHELRNPLNIIEQTVTVLRRRYEKEPDELFDYIPDEVARMNRIITQFLDSSRETPVQKRPGDLAPVLERTLSLLEVQMGKSRVQLEKAWPDSLPTCFDPDRIQQVLLNLCMNALEAMPEGGSLKVTAAVAARSEIRIEVEDTGQGMPPDIQARIFDPFYTQKPSGTGLGLWVVQRIIQDHAGRIEVQSTPGRGTRITLYLPGGTEGEAGKS